MGGGFPFPPARSEAQAWFGHIEFSANTHPVGFNADVALYTRQNPNKLLYILGWNIHGSGLALGDSASFRFTIYLDLNLGGEILDVVPSSGIAQCAPSDAPAYCPGYGSFLGQKVCLQTDSIVSARVEATGPAMALLIDASDWCGIVNVWGLEV
jgi:hypothetical protein